MTGVTTYLCFAFIVVTAAILYMWDEINEVLYLLEDMGL